MAIEPEDGHMSIIDTDEYDSPSGTAFTRHGINYLVDMLSDPSRCYYRPTLRW